MTFHLAGDSALTWAITYSVHSAILGAAGLLAARLWLAPGSRRSAVLKVALFGALFSASMPWKAVSPWEVAGERAAFAAPIATALPVAGPVLPSEVALLGLVAPGVGPVPKSSMAQPFPWQRALVALMASISLLLVTRLVLQRRRFIASLEREPLRDEAMNQHLAAWAKDANTSPIALTGSAHLGAPVALSSTEVCVPLDCWAQLGADDREALLAHEFAHIERRDPAWFTAAAVTERLFFFLPWHRALRQRLNASAEVACDALAAKRVGSRTAVARCLAEVAAWSQGAVQRAPVPSSVPAMAGTPGELVSRVKHLLDNDERPTSRRFVLAAAAGLAAFACCTPALTTRTGASGAAVEDAAIAIALNSGGTAHASLSSEYPELASLEVELRGRSKRARLQRWLEEAALRLPAVEEEGAIGSTPIHDEPILIRCDMSTPFKYVQQIMEMCADRAIHLPNIRIAVGGSDYSTPLSFDLAGLGGSDWQTLQIRMDPLDAGPGVGFAVTPQPWNTRFPEEVPEEGFEEMIEPPAPIKAEDLADLRAVLSGLVEPGAKLLVVLDPRKGVTASSVAEVLSVLDEFEVHSTDFMGSFE